LLPTFLPRTLTYGLHVLPGTTEVTLTPTAADPAATVEVRINEEEFSEVASSEASAPLTLTAGDNIIEIRVSAGTKTTVYQVAVTRAHPVITAVSPASGPVGTPVTIKGTGFAATAADNVVFFGATMAEVTEATSTSLTVTVPAGASYQPVSVTDLSSGL